MCWECQERYPRHRLQRKQLVGDPGMHHGTCVMQMPWCMSGSLTCGGGENVSGIPGAYTTRNFTYLARGPWGHGNTDPALVKSDTLDPWINAAIANDAAIYKFAPYSYKIFDIWEGQTLCKTVDSPLAKW